MPERGGPTAQLGLTYQNGIAALYLGRMLDTTPRSAHERVVDVRVEAPLDVDDVVVRMAHGGRRYIQAKANLQSSGSVWLKLWSDIARQVESRDFSIDDEIHLNLGEHDALASDIRECCQRTTSAVDVSEWLGRLTQPQKKVALSISTAMSAAPDYATLLRVLRRVVVEPISTIALERDYAPRWMPESSTTPEALFNALRSIAANSAPVRESFDARNLRRRLTDTHAITVGEHLSWGASVYRDVVVGRAVIEVPGSDLMRPIKDLFVWPRGQRFDSSRVANIDDDEPSWISIARDDDIDLSLFPTNDLVQLVVTGGPGFGKSALTRALAERACEQKMLPAIIAVPDLVKANVGISAFLQDRINSDFAVGIDWEIAAESGLLVVFMDGLDEVSSSQRTAILERLKTFSLRHPGVPWLLTVRDPTALTTSLNAVIVELRALDATGIHVMIERYCSQTPELGQTVARALRAKPELNKLARIPLFLAILLATTNRFGEVPTDRIELLERYLDLLFRPEQFKPVEPHDVDPMVLRLAAEEAAFVALEREETSFSRRTLQDIVRRLLTPAAAVEPVIQRLVACGIIRPSWPSDFNFPFPIVQEYLAARHLLRVDSAGVPERLPLAVKRPWAQAIQFAIEDHPSSDAIISDLIQRDDDAFSTNVRLAARCIVNGAKVSDATRVKVARRLAHVWARSGWHTRRRVGELIIDGFSNPIIPEIRAELAKPWLFHDGAGELIARVRDNDLTRRVLLEMFKSREHYPYYLHEMQPAIDDLGDEALEIFVETSAACTADSFNLNALASLIANLDSSVISEACRARVARDQSLPLVIRIAAMSLQRGGLQESSIPVIESALDGDSRHDRQFAIRVLPRASNTIALLNSAFRRNANRIEVQEDLLDGLDAALPDVALRAAYLKSLLNRPETSGVRRRIQVFSARYGDSESMRDLVVSIAELPYVFIRATLMIFGHHRDRDFVSMAVERLRSHEFGPAERVAIVQAAATGFTSKFEMSTFLGGGLTPAASHPGFDIIRPLLEGYALIQDYSPTQALAIDERLATSGSSTAFGRLPGRVLEVVRTLSGDEPDHDASHALRLLASRGMILPISDLEFMIERNKWNVGRAALEMLAKHVTPEALDIAIGIHDAATDWLFRDSALEVIELLAGRLGLRVTSVNSRLTVSAA